MTTTMWQAVEGDVVSAMDVEAARENMRRAMATYEMTGTKRDKAVYEAAAKTFLSMHEECDIQDCERR